MNYFTKNKWTAIAFIVLVLLNLTTLAVFFFTRPPMHDGPRNGSATDFLVKEVGLDSIQKNAFAELRKEHQQQMRELREKNREAKEAFFDLLANPDIDAATLDAAATKASQYEKESDLITFRHFQRVRKICRPDQQKKFDQLIHQVLRMTAPEPGHGPGRAQGPPPNGEGRPPHPDGPPPGGENGPPPPRQ
jgi:Spy/CpxP family protein refolding chaperone